MVIVDGGEKGGKSHSMLGGTCNTIGERDTREAQEVSRIAKGRKRAARRISEGEQQEDRSRERGMHTVVESREQSGTRDGMEMIGGMHACS